MAKIREKKYSYERYPETSIWRHPSDYEKKVIQTAEDGELAKFFDWDGGSNNFTFNDKDLKANMNAIKDWLREFPKFDVFKGTFEAFYGPKENYDEYTIKYPNDKYIYLVTDYNPFENLQTKPYTYEPKDDEVIVVDMNLDENNIKEAWRVKSPLDYIEDKLNDNGIDYTIEQAWGDEPYDTWITINDGQDSLADEIICSVVGYAYEWVRDKYGNRKYCKVATDEDTINELNESLKGNHSFKGLTKKVVEAKETCSQDYLRYKKQLQKAKSIDELRKVWQTIKKDYDADMTPEEDKHLANLFLDRKKELKESLKEATGKIQKVSIIKQGNTKDRYKVLVTSTNGKKSEEYLSEDDIKPFVNGLKKRYGDFEIEDPSNTLEDNTDLFKETFNDLVEETKRLMQEEDYDIHDAIYEAVSGLFLDEQIKAIKDYYRSLGNKYIEEGDEWYDCLADDIINDIKYGEGLGENLKEATGKKYFYELTDGEKKEVLDVLTSIAEFVKGDKEISTYLYKYGYQSGSTETTPISIWNESGEVSIMLDPEINSATARKIINKIKKQFDTKELWVYYDKSDGSFPPEIVIKYLNDGKNENLKESWIQFIFEDGSNPYVAKTKEEQDRMFKKYKGRVEQVGDITYLVKNEKKKTNEGLKESKTNAFDWVMDEIKYARSIYDLYKLDDIISDSKDLTQEEISKLRHEISCKRSEMWANQGRGR